MAMDADDAHEILEIFYENYFHVDGHSDPALCEALQIAMAYLKRPFKAKKPRWKDAPRWANYIAVDGSGRITYYEERPFLGVDKHHLYWYAHKTGDVKPKEQDARGNCRIYKRPEE